MLATGVIASSSNGYAAGFVAMPIMLLEVLICGVLAVTGFILLAKDKLFGLYLLLAVVLIPGATVGSALLAKHFEIGAYRVEPIQPIIPPVANKIVFRKGVSSDEVQAFWRDVLSTPHSGGGSMSLPGVQSMSTALPEDGHEILLFSFFETATKDQKAVVRDRILTSSKVLQLKEDTAIDQTDLELPNNSKTDEAKRIDSKVVVVK